VAEAMSQEEETGRDVIAVVTPVLNDWTSLTRLIAELDRLPALAARRLSVLAVDDGSFPPPETDALAAAVSGRGAVTGLTILQLAANLGHQRAIATGLAEARRLGGFDRVIVMDADGEDRPEDVAALIEASDRQRSTVVLALRGRRSEGPGFRAGYLVYRLLFRVMTGHRIQFGNFCILPGTFLTPLTHSPAVWNSLVAGIMRSRLPMVSIPTVRGARYAGRSKMNFVSLATHGLSVISVYMDVMLIRIICATLALSVVIVVAGLVVIGLRLFTGLAIPGWASFMAVSLLVLLIQALMFASVALFQFLSLRSMPTIAPASFAPQLVAREIAIVPPPK
jgi:polyisoprenyl-phosphate glycosyltransferase